MEKQEQRPNVEMSDKERQALWQEYSEMIFMLPRYFAEAKAAMDEMRNQGIPDPAKYQKLRDDILKVYERYDEVTHKVYGYQDGVQKAWAAAMDADSEWQEQHPAGTFGKREADITGESRKEPLELYNMEVEKLLAKAIDLEEYLELPPKALDPYNTSELERLRHEVADIYEELEQLDAKAEKGVSDESRERRSLVELLQKLGTRIRETAPVPAGSLSALRTSHAQVKAQYAAVQHTLTDEQRRIMRTRIAQMTGLVRQAEDEAWGSAFMPEPTPPTPPPPEPEAISDIRQSVQLAMVRASEAAPAVAQAVVASVPTPSTTKRGLLGALGEAFKLK